MKKIYISIFITIFGVNVFSQHIFESNDSIISVATSHVEVDSIENYIQSLQDMETRFMMAENRKEVAQWLEQKFLSFGIDSVCLDSFECYTDINLPWKNYDTTTWQYNVVARIEGSLKPDEVILIGGHYDCITLDTNSEAYSPGADDDASGTAAVLEAARIVKTMNYQPERSLEFVAFAAEELMYFGDAGSEHYASLCNEQGKNIVMMINNDMIGYDNGDWKVGISDFYNSDNATNVALYVAENHTTLNIDQWSPSPGFADAAAFWEEGYECVYLEEHFFNPFYHEVGDVIGNINLDYCSEVIKIGIGSIVFADKSIDVGELVPAEGFVNVYPNPTKDKLNFKVPEDLGSLQIHIVDMKGQVVLSEETYSSSSIATDVSHLTKGIYVLKIVSNKTIYSTKFIKD